MTYMSVFYHRAFTHRAITLSPWFNRFVIVTSSWVTGLDLKGWVCMHRMHHAFVDTEKDPHSPVQVGVIGVFLKQHESFQKTLLNLVGRRRTYTSFVEDLDFDVNWLNRGRLRWLIPLALHLSIATAFAMIFDAKLMGLCYVAGIASHPVQGWLINGVCHRYGYRNFNTQDQSRNNTVLGLLLVGEGYHNNHHQNPNSARFSHRWFEFDFGYLVCCVLEFLGLATIHQRPRRFISRSAEMPVN